MIFPVVALVVFAVLVWVGRSRAKGRDIKLASLLFASLAGAGAAACAAAEKWPYAIALTLLDGWLWMRLIGRPTRVEAAPQPAPQPMSSQMTAHKARSILGVDAGATSEEIQAAYLRLIRAVHPDRGGSAGLAAELNAARERLLRKGKGWSPL